MLREFINDDPDLLEDVVCLRLGYGDPLSLSHLEALGDQEVSHLTGARGLKHLPEVTVIRTRHDIRQLRPEGEVGEGGHGADGQVVQQLAPDLLPDWSAVRMKACDWSPDL